MMEGTLADATLSGERWADGIQAIKASRCGVGGGQDNSVDETRPIEVGGCGSYDEGFAVKLTILSDRVELMKLEEAWR